MAVVELAQLLKLVGTLEDSDKPDSSSVRFRDYLRGGVSEVADLRAYVNACLTQKGAQYDCALQDLVNHIGRLLGFDVQFGRYRGRAGDIGFDGLWESASGWHIVAETKTSEIFAKTSSVLGYVNDLVSEGRLKDPSQILGLYVFGELGSEANQLEKAILAEGRTDALRVMSVGSLLNLLELKQRYQLTHDTILSLLLPSGSRVDPVVDLIFNLLSSAPGIHGVKEAPPETPYAAGGARSYYMLPAADSEDGTPVIENLHRWLDKGLWGLGDRTAHRADIRPGDGLCFYASGIGVVAEGRAASEAFHLAKDQRPSPVGSPYGVRVDALRWFEPTPVQISADLRAQLEYFKGKDLSRNWAWFVQGTKKLSEHDFDLLTGR